MKFSNLLILAGIYAGYKFLKTPKGKEFQNNVAHKYEELSKGLMERYSDLIGGLEKRFSSKKGNGAVPLEQGSAVSDNSFGIL